MPYFKGDLEKKRKYLLNLGATNFHVTQFSWTWIYGSHFSLLVWFKMGSIFQWPLYHGIEINLQRKAHI